MSASENTHDSEFDFDKTFLGMMEQVDARDTRDTGIAQFEDRMLEAQKTLAIHFSKLKSGFDPVSAKEVEDELNDDWFYHDEIATVSGRIYLADPDIEEMMPESWGESSVDDKGRLFYFVENVALKSHGVEAIPDIDEESEAVKGIRMGYVFSDPDDKNEYPLITAFIGELSKHFYKYPTPEEARAKLEDQWPEQLVFIDLLMKPGGTDISLPARAAMLARKLQEHLEASASFRELAEIYINGQLALDQELPYISIVNNRLNYFNGDEINADDAEKYWVTVSIEEPLTVALFDPRINFFTNNDGPVQAYFVGSTYNKEDGDDAEYVAFAAEDLSQFRGTRAFRSIAERAMMALSIADAKLEADQADDLNTAVISNEPLALKKSALKERLRRPADAKPEVIKQVERFINDLQTIAGKLKAQKHRVYSTAEAAKIASMQFVADVIKPLLNRDGPTIGNMILEFSGKKAVRPNIEVSMVKDDAGVDTHMIQVGVNKDHPMIELQDGDLFTGTPVGVEPLIHEHFDEAGETVGYAIAPALKVSLDPRTGKLFNYAGVDLAGYTFDRQTVITLDGSVTISSKMYKDFLSMKEAFTNAKAVYNRHPVMAYLQGVQQTLSSEIASDYTTFHDISKVRALGAAIDTMIAEGQDTNAALKVLDEIFVGRKVYIGAPMHMRDENEVTLIEGLAEDQTLYGNIVDVQSNIIPNTLTFTVTSDTTTVHMPVSGIYSLRF